ncbi:MAG: TRAP transporter small permease [Sneathiella sp.]
MDYRDRYPAILRYLSKLIDVFLCVGGLAVLLLIFTNIVLRGAAGFDLAWSLEATAFLLLWLTFLGCAAAMSRGAHMRVTEVAAHLVPRKLQPFLDLAISLIVAVLLISLIYHGQSISLHTWAQKTTVLYWPVGFLYASLPVGMTITLIFHLYNITLDVRRNFSRTTGNSAKSNDQNQENSE